MPDVYWVRPPLRVAIAYEEWRDEASCQGLPTELFELGDPELITDDDQHDLIAQGLKVCTGCPVRAACLANSSELDRHWTTRGGQPPEGLFPKGERARPRKGVKRGRKCNRGHDNWRPRKNDTFVCVDCRTLRERDRGKRLAPPSESSPTSPR